MPPTGLLSTVPPLPSSRRPMPPGDMSSIHIRRYSPYCLEYVPDRSENFSRKLVGNLLYIIYTQIYSPQ